MVEERRARLDRARVLGPVRQRGDVLGRERHEVQVLEQEVVRQPLLARHPRPRGPREDLDGRSVDPRAEVPRKQQLEPAEAMGGRDELDRPESEARVEEGGPSQAAGRDPLEIVEVAADPRLLPPALPERAAQVGEAVSRALERALEPER